MRLSPELRMILSILGLSLNNDHTHSEGNLSPLGHVNWDRFMHLVNHHRVEGLLFHWIRKLKLENTVPLHVYKNLKDIYESYSNIWENHGQVLKKILMGCHEREMDVILLKGAQLAQSNYPGLPLRPIGDIDLLVREFDRSEVIKFMLEKGFNLYETNQTCDKFFVRNKQQGKPIFIEIHSNLQTRIRLNRSFSIDIDEFWNGTQKRTFDGFPFLELCPTHNLIYLGAHLGHHHFSRLIWTYDIALLVHRHKPEIDWKRLEYICGRVRIKNSLYYSLSLCQKFFGIPIPQHVLRGLSPSWVRRKMGHFIIRRYLRSLEKSRVNRFNQFLIKAILIDSWREAIRWFLFPTREWMKQEYFPGNTHEIYTYYLLHPLLYLIKTMRTPMR